MDAQYRIVVLNDSVTRNDIVRLFSENGFEIANEFEKSGDSAYQLVGQSDDGTQMKYTDDQFLCAKFIEVLGPGIRKALAAIRMALSYFTDDDILEAADDDGASAEERAVWLPAAAALREQAGHERLARLIGKRLLDKAPEVRRSAVVSAGWLTWPELVARVADLQNDEDETVADYARRILKSAGK